MRVGMTRCKHKNKQGKMKLSEEEKVDKKIQDR